MTNTESLVHRYVDQELSLEERVNFVSRLARDDAFRDEVLALERLALDASRLPRPAVPAGFVTGVINQLDRPMPSRPVWRRFTDLAIAPRTLRWNLAEVAAVAAVVLIAFATLAGGRLWWLATPAPSVASSASAAASKVFVRLVVVQPGAQTVQVAGDFNGWDPARTSLQPLDGGAWAVTLPLAPGRYEYMFVVNGREWVADPFAVERSDDGFGSQNAVLDVRSSEGAV